MRFTCLCAGLLLPIAPVALSAQDPSAGNDPIVFVKKGIGQNKKGNYSAALNSFNRALEIDPTDSAAYEGRGETHLAQGDLTDAVSDFSRTLQIEPQNEPAIHHRAIAEMRQGNFKSAIGDFDHAVTLADTVPGESSALFLDRARAKYFTGDFNGAIADLNQAVSGSPDLGEGYFFRGLAEEANAQPVASADDFAKAASLGVPEAALWWWVAKMDAHHENEASAGLPDLLNKGLAGHPDPWLSELGDLLLQKTTETQIQADARNGKAGGNRQLEAWFFIGLSREFSGDASGAKQAYQNAADAGDPDSPLTVESRRRMKKLSP